MGAEAAPARSFGIDALRGLAMIVMTLDHTREFFTSATFRPLDLDQTTPAYFFTRWVTHFAAPIFVLLAGVSAQLAGRRRTQAQLSVFLAKRGLFLVALEMTVVSWAWTFSPEDFVVLAQVIWALGWSMVALSVLLWLPRNAVGALAVAMIVGHNLLDGFRSGAFGEWAFGWQVVHEPGPSSLMGGTFIVDYPLVPWIGVMALGYACAPVLGWPAARRDPILLLTGIGCVALFIVLRATRVYGDPAVWDPAQGVLGFLKVTKYPVSLQFLLVTLGPPIALFPLLDRMGGTAARLVATYGQAPLFYYVAHLYVIHGLALGLGLLLGWPLDALRNWLLAPPQSSGWGWDLPVVYLVSMGVACSLLPATARWARLKRERKDIAILSYL